MKKSIKVFIIAMSMLLGVVGFTACDSKDHDSEELETVAVNDSDRNAVLAVANPTRVAIYDYSILDILYNVGFEKTGIEQLIVPTKSSLPGDLSFYKEQPDSSVVSGGSLFYIDWDVLDIVQPQLVILGGRSFGMNANGDRLSTDEVEKYKEDTKNRYNGTRFVKLSVNSSNSNLTADMENNVAALAKIFPAIKTDLEMKLAEIKAGISEIKGKAQDSGVGALFCMMVDQTTLSVFNSNSRFDMLYEDFGFNPVDTQTQSWSNQHGFDIRAEYVLSKNPGAIFVLDRSATVGSGAGYDNFINDPIIQQTNAFQNNNIFLLTGEAWYTMTGGFTAAERMIEDINQYFNQ